MKRLAFLLLLAAVLLPVAAQEVEVASHRRLLKDVEGPAFYPVLNTAGTRLLFTTEDGALKFHDLVDGVTTTITRDYVAGHDACWGGDGKVYFVTQKTNENHLIYRAGQCYDPSSHQTVQVTDLQHGAVRAVPSTRGGALKAPQNSYQSSGDIGSAAWTEGRSSR